MSTWWGNIIDQLNALGGQRALDTATALVIFIVVMGLAWFMWRRRSQTQTSHIRSLETEQLRLTAELATLLHRYEIALRGSDVTVFTQDLDLRYTSISNDFLGHKVGEIIDRTDEELIPAESRNDVIEMKRSVFETGQSKDR